MNKKEELELDEISKAIDELMDKEIVLKENDHDVLHKVKSWADSDSEAVTFRCEHCGNYVWGSVNNANLYENRPPEYAYDFECTELGE